jgi:CheY-like chemotaxis protein
MRTPEALGKNARALEITVALAGRRIGLCGFDAAETEAISAIFQGTRSWPMHFDERLLAESAGVCDGLLIKLANLSTEGLRAAATSLTPVLAVGSSQALLQGHGAAYSWPRDFLNEPWSEAELLVRLFRLLEPHGSVLDVIGRESRTEPLVLLADDDPELVTLVDVTLRNDNIRCGTANNGLTALRMARELLPDLILLDIRMPAMDGFEVLQTIRSDLRLETLPVMLLTGCDDPADVARGGALHADAYLAKPVSPNVLLNRVRRLLSTHGSSALRWSRSLPGNGGSAERPSKRWIPVGRAQAEGVKYR